MNTMLAISWLPIEFSNFLVQIALDAIIILENTENFYSHVKAFNQVRFYAFNP